MRGGTFLRLRDKGTCELNLLPAVFISLSLKTVDVHEMVINRKVLCKRYASTEKNIEVTKQTKHFMNFLRVLLILSLSVLD